MPQPRVHRDYENDYPSVTTALSELRKIGLEFWYRYNTPQFIADAMKSGKEAGTDTHHAIEHFIETGELKVETKYPEEVSNALHSFVMFRRDFPNIILGASELKMTSEIYKYNGTMDITATIDNVPVIGDWKTSTAKKEEKPVIYDEYMTQVSAYRHLYKEVHGIDVNTAFIVALAKDKVAYNYRIIEKEELDDNFNEVFLPALKICQFKRRKK